MAAAVGWLTAFYFEITVCHFRPPVCPSGSSSLEGGILFNLLRCTHSGSQQQPGGSVCEPEVIIKMETEDSDKTYNLEQPPSDEKQQLSGTSSCITNCKSLKKKVISKCKKSTVKPQEITVMPPKVYKCEVCGIEFDKARKRRNHLRKHSDKRPFSCMECGKSFKTKMNLRSHNVNRHGYTSDFVCSHCGKAFAVRQALENHERTHTGEKPFVCDICPRSFTSKNSLYMHRSEHFANEFKCRVCGEIFIKRSLLYNHIRGKHEPLKKKCICMYCGAGFIGNLALTLHIRTHTKEKPYICDLCEKGFPSKDQLNLHVRRHLGIKPYQCYTCGKSFAQNATLTVHARTHTGERPHVCRICHQSFTQLPVLKQHLRGHNAQLYCCDLCGRGFDLKKDLLMHQKIEHPCPPA
jgi:KRAB domain-containing zinc finger protein